MFKIIFAVILVLIALGFLIAGNRKKATDRYGEETTKGFDLRWVAIPLIAIAGIFIMWASMFRLAVGEAAVIRTFSGTVLDQPVTEAGIHTKAPWNSVEKWNIRNLQLNFSTGELAKDTDTVRNDVAVSSSTIDGATFDFDETISYALDPNKVVDLYRQYKSQDAFVNLVMLPGARSASRNGPTTFAAVNIRNERAKLGTTINNDLDSRFSQYGVQIVSVDVREIRLPKEIVDNLNAIQTRLSDVEKARADLEKARIQAEETKTDAQAQSDADQIIRCGATSETVTEIVNGKETRVVKVTPIPMNKCQNRLNEQVLTSKYIDMLEKAAASGSAIYVVPPGGSNLLNLPAPAAAAK